MRKCLLAFVSAIFILFSCTATKGKNKVAERCTLLKKENEDGLSFTNLKSQEPLLNKHDKTRGVVDGYLISLASEGIKKMIDNRHKRYTAQFNLAVSDLHFYNNLSTNSTFDPTGIKFQGFTLVRVLRDAKDKRQDTAFVADFVLDTANVYEIANNGIFRLRLNKLDYRFPKAKMRSGKKRINIDFQITFTTSYINDQGNFFDNVTLGKFYFSVRNAPVDRDDPEYAKFYDSLRNKRLTGSCFIVPRSTGYYVSNNNELEKSYSWGNYSISAVIKESSKDAFVDQLIYNNSGLILDAGKSEMNKASKKYIKSQSAPASATPKKAK